MNPSELELYMTGLPEKWQKLLRISHDSAIPVQNQIKILTAAYGAEHQERITDKMISSNERLAKSNEKYAARMIWLTAGLFFATILQAVAMIVGTFRSH